MKRNIHHLGQEKQKKSNFLQLKSYKISGGNIGQVKSYGLNSSGLTPQQAFNARKAAEAENRIAREKKNEENRIAREKKNEENRIAREKNEQTNVQALNTVINVLNNSQAVSKNTSVNSVVQVVNAVAANSSNNKKEYIRLLTNISNKIDKLLKHLQ
jgi:hypothetical protein